MARGRGARRRGRGRPVHEGPPGRVAPRADRAGSSAARPKVVGQNSFTETEDSPLTAGADGGILTPDPEVERERIEALEEWQAERDQAAVDAALDEARRGRRATSRRTSCRRRSPPPRPAPPPASGPSVLREVFGAYRGPTGVGGAAAGRRPRPARRRSATGSTRSPSRSATGSGSWSASPASTATRTAPSRSPCAPATSAWRSIYQGIRLTPEQIAEVGRRRRTSTWSASRSSPAPTASWSREVVELLRDDGRRRPGRRRRDHPRRRRRPPARGRRRRRLHAEGLRHQPDHGRDRELVGRAATGAAPAGLMSDAGAERRPQRLAALLPLLVAGPRGAAPLRRDPPRRPRDRRARRSASTRSRRPSSSASTACTTSRT